MLHASAVTLDGRGLLITGAAGAGKTTLALELIALGARLVADDRVRVRTDRDGVLWLAPPPNLAGLVEVRGFGLVRMVAAPEAPLALVADLDAAESERLPPRRSREILGIACPAILCKGRPGLPAALHALLSAKGWLAEDYFADPVPGGGTRNGRVQ